MRNTIGKPFIAAPRALALLALTCMVLAIAAPSIAQDEGSTKSKPKGSSEVENKNVGIGIIVGEPTGLNIKWFLANGQAISGSVAWSLSGDSDLHLQAEYLFHRYDLISVEKGRLPLYFGVGARLILRENADNTFGARVPVGLAYEFSGAPFDVFVEVVPILDLTPDTDFDLEGAIGGRFWF